MPKDQYKNAIINSQNNFSPLEPSNLITVGPKKCNTAKVQNRDNKTTFILC